MNNVIDTRELAEELRDLEFQEEEFNNGESSDALDDDEVEKLKELRELADEITDFYNGETLISEGYFKDYAQELAHDIGAIDGDEKWPLTCINWEQAAEELLMDYTSVEYDGDTYYVRSC